MFFVTEFNENIQGNLNYSGWHLSHITSEVPSLNLLFKSTHYKVYSLTFTQHNKRGLSLSNDICLIDLCHQ